jgi:phosphoglucomutase
MYEKYVDATIKERVGEKFADGFGVAYTPLHGAGAKFILEVLQKVGVKNVHTVKSQMTPDPEFTNCKNPNPEKPASMEMVIDLAKKTSSALAFATDPDADRIGVAVLHNKEYSLLTGNEVAVLLSDYLLSKSELKNPIIIKTIVTTVLIDKIATKYGAQVINTLTGFKYIGEQMDRIENFLFGCEESYGYLKGTHVRDKDAIVACMLICEMAMHYKEKGKTLVDALNGIYAEHGHCTHKLLTYEFKGLQGEIEKQKLLTEFRTNPPTKFASVPVVSTIDYLNQTEKDLPKSDILEYNLANASSQYQIIIRPSGTESLIKVYIAAIGDLPGNKDFIDAVTKEMDKRFLQMLCE